MHKTLDSVGLIHDTYPGTEACIREAVAETADDINDDKEGPRWVERKGHVGGDMADRCHDGDSSLAIFHVDRSVSDGGDRIAGKRCQEDKRYLRVGKIVVLL